MNGPGPLLEYYNKEETNKKLNYSSSTPKQQHKKHPTTTTNKPNNDKQKQPVLYCKSYAKTAKTAGGKLNTPICMYSECRQTDLF